MSDVGELLDTWEPLPAGLAGLQAVHASAINAGVAQRCGAEHLLDALQRSRWTTPELAFAYYADADDADVEAVLAHDDPPPLRLDGHADRPWLAFAFRTFERALDSTVAFELIERPEDGADLARALVILRAAWPEMAFAIDRLVRAVVWFRHPGWENSATLAQAFGAVFISTGRGVASSLESIVHETTHLELQARQAVDPQIVTRDARLIADLHAWLVSQRTGHALRVSAEHLAPRERDEAVALVAAADVRRATAATTLERQARFTAHGRALFESGQRVATAT